MSDKEKLELYEGYGLTCRECSQSCIREGFLFCKMKHDAVEKDEVCPSFDPRRKYGTK